MLIVPCRAGPGTTGPVPWHGPFSFVPCRAWAGPKFMCLGPAHLATYTRECAKSEGHQLSPEKDYRSHYT